jgi:hypothetical protein
MYSSTVLFYTLVLTCTPFGINIHTSTEQTTKEKKMSKQSVAKENQGYTKTPKKCSDCKHFRFKAEATGRYNTYTIKRELRCGIGGFKVNKTATCNIHEPAEA